MKKEMFDELLASAKEMVEMEQCYRFGMSASSNGKVMQLGEKTEMKDNNFPDFDFKIRNGDDPRVRQWLKDNGCAWISGANIVTDHYRCPFLYVSGTSVSGWAAQYKFEAVDAKELEIKFKTVVDWEEIKPNNPLKVQLEYLRNQQEEIAKRMKELEEKIK